MEVFCHHLIRLISLVSRTLQQRVQINCPVRGHNLFPADSLETSEHGRACATCSRRKVQELVVFGLCHPSPVQNQTGVLHVTCSLLSTVGSVNISQTNEAALLICLPLLSWHERPAHSSLSVIVPLCVSSSKSGSWAPPAFTLRGKDVSPSTSPMDLRACHL